MSLRLFTRSRAICAEGRHAWPPGQPPLMGNRAPMYSFFLPRAGHGHRRRSSMRDARRRRACPEATLGDWVTAMVRCVEPGRVAVRCSGVWFFWRIVVERRLLFYSSLRLASLLRISSLNCGCLRKVNSTRVRVLGWQLWWCLSFKAEV